MRCPSLDDLTLLRWEDDNRKTHRFRLLKLISSEWWNSGILLGLKADELENIQQKTNDNVQRLTYIFTQWIDNYGHPPRYPLSWDGVCELLCDLGRDRAAEDLAVALSRALGSKVPKLKGKHRLETSNEDQPSMSKKLRTT